MNVSPACVNNFLFQEIHNKGEKKNQAQSDLIHLCDYNLLCAHNFRGETQTPDSGYNTHCLFVSGWLAYLKSPQGINRFPAEQKHLE